MSTIYVSSASQLATALSQAIGGETIVLSSGSYGALDISGKSFSSYVTLVSEEDRGAVFTSVDISNTDYLRIDNVHVDSPTNGSSASKLVSVSDGSSHIQFLNSEVNGKVDNVYSGHYGLYTKDVSDVTFAGNYVHDIKIGGVFYSAQDLTVSGNTINYTGADSFKFIGVQDVLIEGNMGSQNFYPAPGEHLDFIQFQGSDSSDIVIRGNVSLPGTHSNVQGIFFDDAHYTNVLVEDNVIATGMIRGVSVSSGTNFVARNNTLINLPGEGSKATKVLGADESYGNIQTSYLQDAGLGDNLTLQNTDPDKPLYYGDYFANPEAGRGMTLEDLLPILNTLAETMGAVGTIEAFLAGNIPATPSEPEIGQNPVPEPEPTPTPEEDTDGGTDQGQIAPAPSGAAYAAMGAHEFNSASDVIEVAHNSNLALDAATISFSFNADTVSGRHGLISKDAYSYTGGGNHLVSYIENGVLVVRFQDGEKDEIARIDGINVDTDYDLQISFGDDNVSVWLNGEQAHSADFSTSWATNMEYLQFGANGWSSISGEAGFSDVFDGTISDISVAEGNLNPAQLQDPLSDGSDGSGTSGSIPAPEPEPTPTPEEDTDGGTDQGQIAPAPSGAAYAAMGAHEFNSASDVIEVAHNSNLALDAATISFSFNADTVSGRHGLISKDAYSYTGGGNHLVSYIENGVLVVRFQDGEKDEIARIDGINVDTDYDLQISFGDDNVSVWLNGEQAHSADFSTSWATNMEYLQFGANGWSSISGEAGFSDVFDGTISDISVAEGNLNPAQLQDPLSDGSDGSGTSGSIPAPEQPAYDLETSGGTLTPKASPNETDASVVYEQTGEQIFNGTKSSIVNLDHDNAYEVQEGTISFTFNADDLNGKQGLFSKDAYSYAGGGNHVSAMLNGDELYIRFQDEDSDAVFRAPGIEAGEDYEVQTWFGDGEVGLAVNGELIGIKAFEIDLSLNNQNLQFGGLGWGSSDGGDKISNAFDGTISDMMILDQAVPIDNGDLIA